MANQVQGIDLDELLGGEEFTKMTPSGGGQYVQPGEYVFKIVQCTLKKGFKGTTFIGENEISQILKTEEQGLSPGDKRNLVEVLTGKNAKICQANMKGYLLAACESLYQTKIDHKNVNPAFVARVLAADQPLAGVYVKCSAFAKPKANNAPGLVTIKNWSMVTNAELAALGVQQPAPPAS